MNIHTYHSYINLCHSIFKLHLLLDAIETDQQNYSLNATKQSGATYLDQQHLFW